MVQWSATTLRTSYLTIMFETEKMNTTQFQSENCQEGQQSKSQNDRNHCEVCRCCEKQKARSSTVFLWAIEEYLKLYDYLLILLISISSSLRTWAVKPMEISMFQLENDSTRLFDASPPRVRFSAHTGTVPVSWRVNICAVEVRTSCTYVLIMMFDTTFDVSFHTLFDNRPSTSPRQRNDSTQR